MFYKSGPGGLLSGLSRASWRADHLIQVWWGRQTCTQSTTNQHCCGICFWIWKIACNFELCYAELAFSSSPLLWSAQTAVTGYFDSEKNVKRKLWWFTGKFWGWNHICPSRNKKKKHELVTFQTNSLGKCPIKCVNCTCNRRIGFKIYSSPTSRGSKSVQKRFPWPHASHDAQRSRL